MLEHILLLSTVTQIRGTEQNPQKFDEKKNRKE